MTGPSSAPHEPPRPAGSDDVTPTAEQRAHLDDEGYVVLPGFIPPDLLAALRAQVEALFIAEGDQAGSEFKQEPGCRRLANLVDKGELFRQTWAHPAILPLVAHVLGRRLKLSSLNARSVNPASGAPQPLHADMGAVADDQGYWVANVVFMLDDYRSDNGALRAVPGSHRWRRLPQDELADPTAPHPDEVLITGTAGTVVVMNAHTWHGGLANTTARPRTALHAFYCRWDKPQQQYQKRLVRPEVQANLPPELRQLLALDDRHNDAVSAEVAVRSGFLK